MRIRNLGALTAHGNTLGRSAIAQVMEAGLEAADPYYNALTLVKREGNRLIVGTKDFIPLGDPKQAPEIISLDQVERIFVFGAGKGVQRIAMALEETLGSALTGGRVILKHHDEHALRRIAVSFGGHPVPDAACVAACKKLVQDIQACRLTPKDLVFTIIGNGASSLMTLPPEGVGLENIMRITEILQIEKGLPTDEVNKCRNQVDQLKGGRLTRMLFPARLIHIEAIDVNEPNVLGGVGYDGWIQKNYWLHTLPDQRTARDAIDLLHRHDVWERMDDVIKEYLTNKARLNPCLSVQEYEKSGSRFFGAMSQATNFMKAAENACIRLGFAPYVLTRKTGVEASAMGKLAGNMALQIARENGPFSPPCAVLLTGEMVVSVGKHSGVGGRNQEFCTAAARTIAGSSRIVIAAADTDGTDGPGGFINEEAAAAGCSILAGGIVDGYTAEEAREKSVDLDYALKTHATSDALWRLDSGIWATQNISLNDLIVILVMREREESGGMRNGN